MFRALCFRSVQHWVISLLLQQNDFITDRFLANLQIFHNTHRKLFPRSLFLLKSETLVCRPAKLIEKEQFCKGFFWNFLSFLNTYQYLIGVFSLVVRNSTTYSFSEYWPRCLVQIFQNNFMKPSATEFSRVSGL